jgi:hypothetical protein
MNGDTMELSVFENGLLFGDRFVSKSEIDFEGILATLQTGQVPESICQDRSQVAVVLIDHRNATYSA